MSTKARLKRMFSEEGKCFDVAIDHGFFNEHSFLASIEDMKQAQSPDPSSPYPQRGKTIL